MRLFKSQMPVGKGCSFPPPRSPDDESLLDEERFIDLFERPLVLPNCRRYGVGSDRSTVELCDYGPKNLVVDCVQSPLVDVQRVKGISGNLQIDMTVPDNLSEVPYPSQERVRDSGRSTASEGNLKGCILLYTYI